MRTTRVSAASLFLWVALLPGCQQREATDRRHRLELEKQELEDRASILKHGLNTAIAVNGQYQPWLRPHPIPTRDQIRKTIKDLL